MAGVLVLAYLVAAAVIGFLVFIEVANEFKFGGGPGFGDIIFGFICGIIGGAVWPLTLFLFGCKLAFSDGFYRYEPNTAIVCVLTGGHRWRASGGIEFRGLDGITPYGTQGLHCGRCRHDKYVWPWGDERFDTDERFGYSPR